jgi:hypothetical protein
VDVLVGVRRPRLEQQHLHVGVLAQAVGEHATGRSCPHDHVVIHCDAVQQLTPAGDRRALPRSLTSVDAEPAASWAGAAVRARRRRAAVVERRSTDAEQGPARGAPDRGLVAGSQREHPDLRSRARPIGWPSRCSRDLGGSWTRALADQGGRTASRSPRSGRRATAACSCRSTPTRSARATGASATWSLRATGARRRHGTRGAGAERTTRSAGCCRARCRSGCAASTRACRRAREFPAGPRRRLCTTSSTCSPRSSRSVGGEPVPRIASWPARSYAWALVLTHDVETSAGRRGDRSDRRARARAGAALVVELRPPPLRGGRRSHPRAERRLASRWACTGCSTTGATSSRSRVCGNACRACARRRSAGTPSAFAPRRRSAAGS